jgi:hypothetical protein
VFRNVDGVIFSTVAPPNIKKYTTEFHGFRRISASVYFRTENSIDRMRTSFKRSRHCAPVLVSEAALECLFQSGW